MFVQAYASGTDTKLLAAALQRHEAEDARTDALIDKELQAEFKNINSQLAYILLRLDKLTP